MGEPTIEVRAQDYLYFVERALRGMTAIVEELGDDLACVRPATAGANTPYGLLTHCLGVAEYWGGHLVAGREVERDRVSEFAATGPVEELLARADETLAMLSADVGRAISNDALRHEPDPAALGPDRPLSQGAALFHLYEELAQHHGQMELIRDVLTRTERDGDVAEPGFDVSLGWLRDKRGVKWHRPGPDVLPAWVADMDFPVAAPIREAIERCLDRGDLGYPDWSAHPLGEAFSLRMLDQYGWRPDPSQVRGVTDLIQALQVVMELTTEPGDAVAVITPTYPPFLTSVAYMHRQLQAVPLEPVGSCWQWDPVRLDAALRARRTKLLLLVNPHNPTGRVFTRGELESVAELAERHDVIVISDEIHAEFTYQPHLHIPFASLSRETAARTITITSATKTFNIAGLRTAVAHVGPPRVRELWDQQPPDMLGAVNVLGVEATLAAWRDGDDWLAALREHLADQRAHLMRRLAPIAGLRVHQPEASYLAWLDFRLLGLTPDPATFFRRRAKVELSAGSDFGPNSAGFARLNFATTRPVLDAVLDAMTSALESGQR